MPDPILPKVCPYCNRTFVMPPGTFASRRARRKTCGVIRCWASTPLSERFWAKVDRTGGPDACWLWTGALNRPAGKGYGSLGINATAVRTAHRLSWELHNGPIPDGLWVLHRCDNRTCVNPAHLWLGTAQDNVDDMHDKGRDRKRGLKGEEHHGAKLTSDRVRAIRRRLRARERQWKLAIEFGVSRSTIQAIAHGLTWRHLLEESGDDQP